MIRLSLILFLLVQVGCDTEAASAPENNETVTTGPVDEPLAIENRGEVVVAAESSEGTIDVRGWDYGASLNEYFGLSAMVIRDGKVAWVDEQGFKSASALQSFEYAADVLAQLAPITVADGRKVFVGDENGNKVVFFQGNNPSAFDFRITYDPAKKVIIQRMGARD